MLTNDDRKQISRTQDSADKIGLLISVEDTGIGIKEEDFNKLFKVFGKLK